MAWDLRRALLKKEETESARLADFEFRLRVRALRLLAPQIGLADTALTSLVAEKPDGAILALLSQRCGIAAADLAARYDACLAEARAQLVRELGDPAPHRLA